MLNDTSAALGFDTVMFPVLEHVNMGNVPHRRNGQRW